MSTAECVDRRQHPHHTCTNCSAVLKPYSLQRDNGPSTTVTFEKPVRSRSGSLGKDELHCRSNHPILASETPLISRGSGQDLTSAMDTSPALLKQYLFDHGVHVERVTIQYPSVHWVLEIDKAQAKSVFVRFTFDNWRTYLDQDALMTEGSDGVTAQFKATLRIPQDCDCTEVEFAVCYKSAGCEYWDNNEKKNYKFKLCRPESQPPTPITSPAKSLSRDFAV